MEVSVVVCTYNRKEYISECLEHLADQSVSGSSYEVVVVDNNSTDGTTDLIKQALEDTSKYRNFVYILETNQGLSYARNRGIDEAKGDIITFIDDDAFASKRFIEEIVNAFNSEYKPDAIGGRILPRYESDKPAWMSAYLIPLVSAIDLGDKPRAFKKNKYPIGANMSFRSHLFESSIRFDVNLGRKGKGLQGSEEKDLFLKLKKEGCKVMYFPGPWVEHLVPDKRIQPEFIKKLAKGIGRSERIRTLSISKSEYRKLLWTESKKWAGTIVLAVYYFLLLRFQKARMLLKFRYWVSQGISDPVKQA